MIYNQILEKLVLPAGDAILGSRVIRELRNWRRYSAMTEVELQALQRQRLAHILEFCAAQIPYYQELKIARIPDPYERVSLFPIIDKNLINENPDRFLHNRKTKLIQQQSSGSSGINSVTYVNKNEQSISRAIQILWWEWAGYKIGDPLIQTGINPRRNLVKSVKDRLLRTRYISAFGHSDESIMAVLNSIRGTDFLTLAGFASSLGLFADIAERHGISDISFKTVISWGDKLFPHYRDSIQQMFNSAIFETYGCCEGLMIGAQKDLEHMYIMSPHVFIEVVDDAGNDVADGDFGNILVTRLDGFSMPLVRYRLGDLAIKRPRSHYPKNRELNYPILERVIGRDTDIIKTASGKYMTVHFFTGIFEHIPEVKQFRIIQRSIDEIEIDYIPGPNFREQMLTDVAGQIHGYIGEKLPIKFVKTNSIPPTPSGKPQLVQSSITNFNKK